MSDRGQTIYRGRIWVEVTNRLAISGLHISRSYAGHKYVKYIISIALTIQLLPWAPDSTMILMSLCSPCKGMMMSVVVDRRCSTGQHV